MLGCAAFAQPPAMTKLVFVIEAPDLPADALVAKPKTIYLATDKYARIEQPAELASELKNLIVVNQPDIWVVDAKKGIAQHSINPGPDLTVHNPVLGPDAPDELFEFEYGHEVSFFEQHFAKHLEAKNVNGKKCDAWEIKAHDYRIELCIDAITKNPLNLTVEKGGTSLFQIRYLRYDTRAPFDSSLFAPPADVKISDEDQ